MEFLIGYEMSLSPHRTGIFPISLLCMCWRIGDVLVINLSSIAYIPTYLSRKNPNFIGASSFKSAVEKVIINCHIWLEYITKADLACVGKHYRGNILGVDCDLKQVAKAERVMLKHLPNQIMRPACNWNMIHKSTELFFEWSLVNKWEMTWASI